jgi:hypothetical protein
MWSHYANSHKGICVGYKFKSKIIDSETISITETQKGFYKGIYVINTLMFKKVQYSDTLPKAYNPLSDSNERILEFIYTKDNCWKYENEHRMSATQSELQKGNRVKLVEGSISVIYFGINCKEDTIDEIIDKLSIENRPTLYKGYVSNLNNKINFKKIVA